MSKISVIVCTYNRSALLKQALQSLVDQTLSKECYEVIIVDNASTDNTKEVTEEFLKHKNFRYLYETNQGLSYSRNLGWRGAQGEYVAYMDDDAKADKHWLAEAVRVIDEISPDIFGGTYSAYYLDKKPDWFLDKYGSHSLGEETHFLKHDEWLSGSNIILKKGLLEKLGGFNTNLGMSGGKISYGEETQLIIRAREEYPKSRIYYDPKLVIYHLVPALKMSLGWFAKYNFQCGRTSDLVFKNQAQISLSLEIISLFKFFFYSMVTLKEILVGLLFREKDQYKYLSNYLVEKAFPHLYSVGCNLQRVLYFAGKK